MEDSLLGLKDRIRKTPLQVEIKFSNLVNGETTKAILTCLADLWRAGGGLGLLPGKQVRMNHALRLELTGISCRKDSDEMVRKRTQWWQKAVLDVIEQI